MIKKVATILQHTVLSYKLSKQNISYIRWCNGCLGPGNCPKLFRSIRLWFSSLHHAVLFVICNNERKRSKSFASSCRTGYLLLEEDKALGWSEAWILRASTKHYWI